MIRLTILTLAGLFAVLSLYGTPQGDRPDPAVADASADTATTETAADAIAAATVTEAVATQPAAIQPDEVQQTPEKVQDFPGPPLRPSPEYVGSTEQAEADLAAPEGATILYVTGDRVNFRAGPSTNDRVVGALLRGSPVEALNRTDEGWVQLRDAQGREGYMSAQFLSPELPR